MNVVVDVVRSWVGNCCTVPVSLAFMLKSRRIKVHTRSWGRTYRKIWRIFSNCVLKILQKTWNDISRRTHHFNEIAHIVYSCTHCGLQNEKMVEDGQRLGGDVEMRRSMKHCAGRLHLELPTRTYSKVPWNRTNGIRPHGIKQTGKGSDSRHNPLVGRRFDNKNTCG